MRMIPIVAIDLETTGLDPTKDRIIEIGAVKFENNSIIDSFQSLINPQRLIPSEITQLTSITNEMVRNAPVFSDVQDDLTKFIGNSPILGQNLQFDLGFLNANGMIFQNKVIDTYDLASVLLPTASRYNLSSLADLSEIDMDQFHAHRAKDDAHMTYLVFLKMVQESSRLPVDLINEIVKQGKGIRWGGKWFFEQVLQERISEEQKVKPYQVDYGTLFGNLEEMNEPALKKNKEIEEINVDDAASYIEHGGAFSTYIKNFESRSQQIEMTRAVASAFNKSQHFLVEAGTGTGKSYAYLIPAAMWSEKNKARVVISTNTINLQDQLINKDVPDLQGALKKDINAVVLKGRRNYLCPRRLDGLRYRGPRSKEELRILAKILVWLYSDGKGDRNELNITGNSEWDVWSKLSADDETCGGEACLERLGGVCPYFLARQRALRAHIIVVNHALLLADVATENRVLPEYDYLIVDEAHHLEDATTNALSFKATNREIKRIIEDLGNKTSGAIGNLTAALQSRLKASPFNEYFKVAEQLIDISFRLDHEFNVVFSSINSFMSEVREGKPVSEYGQSVRIDRSTTRMPIWSDIEIKWQKANTTLEGLLKYLSVIVRDVSDMGFNNALDIEEALSDLARIQRKIQQIQINFSTMVFEPDPQNIYWIEIEPRFERLSVNIAPLHIGSLMEKHLWFEKESIILTSATLTTNGEFDYLRKRLSADDAEELILGSPFDYETSTLLYLPTDMPEPINHNQYQMWIERTLMRVAKATSGRMLSLFTSYKQLRRTSRVITPILNKENIHVYEQGEGASPSALLDTFRTTEKAVLLGTRSFWEGVDVPGDALSVLMIVRLPFDVPNDPIISARSETFENPFFDYQVPEAILRFRQGFGRLIRTKNDRGIVAVLDRRITSKQYGQLFINSLPECTLKKGPIEELPDLAARWLNI